MAFQIVKAKTSGTSSVVDIASDVSFVDVTASASYTDANGVVSYVALQAHNIELGYFLISRIFEDFLTTADVTYFNIGKTFNETSSADDTILLSQQKYFGDVAGVSTVLDLGLQKRITPDFAQSSDDISYQVDFKRTFIEQGEYGDIIVLATTKLITDTAQTDDNIVFSTATSKEDTLNASELISNGLGKVFTNSFGVADEATLNQNKNISDGSSFVDDIRFDLGLGLSDFINATDDFLGEANIDDDQTMHFGKTLLINGSASDALARAVQYNRVFGDDLSVNEALSLSANKTLSEQITTNDTLERTVQFDRNFSDLSIVTTAIAIDTGRALQDNGTVAESAIKSPNKVNNDSALITDYGALFWQDYVEDPSYFGEDYVGNNQTF